MTGSITTGKRDVDEEGTPENVEEREPSAAAQPKGVSRKEKRKALKKEKRKQIRKELAEKARSEEESRLNDPEEQRKVQLEEEREKERLENERKEFEERERIFLQELERKKKAEEEEERRNAAERETKQNQAGVEEDSNKDDEWEYVEEGPPEIIWQGNEIIVKKNKVRVKKKDASQCIEKEDPNRPTSNPLPPQSDAYAAYKNAPVTSAQLLDTVAQQVPNFGTEQDKAHCPFHIKTGACRFGSRCNRVHYYPDKSSTLLIKNMYNGPGLAWEQDEGLELQLLQGRFREDGEKSHWRHTYATSSYTDEEVERSYEEFYEDVHTEFLKFGEIINFKVCRNGSFHLRGNVYVHYKSLESAVMAYNSVHGRYFAGKQVKCEFVSLTRWKVAICGEYMKSRLKTCSRGTACNFLHCFSNPGGDYEWADCDKPPPRYWVKKMSALFGYSEESWYDKQVEQPSPKDHQNSGRIFTSDRDSYHYKRYMSTETNRRRHEENDVQKSRHHGRQKSGQTPQISADNKDYEDDTKYKNTHHHNNTADDNDSDEYWSDRDIHRRRHKSSSRNSSRRHNRKESESSVHYSRSGTRDESSDEDIERHRGRSKDRSRHRSNVPELSDRRTRRRDRDEGDGEMGHQESPKKRKRCKSKSAIEKNAELRRSVDSDRWGYDETSESSHKLDYEDVGLESKSNDQMSDEISAGKKPRDRRRASSRKRHSDSLEEETSKYSHSEKHQSHDGDHGNRVKRKRI